MASKKIDDAVDPGTGGVAVAPGLEYATGEFRVPQAEEVDAGRTLFLSGLTILIAIGAALAAQVLTALIAFITNVAFYHRISAQPLSPSLNQLGLWVIVVPVIGGIIIGLMARYGSMAIRGHGIPEAMEQILRNGSRVPARVMFLKPVSAAVAIGTGGPFGAEGPIIATGGALGSVVGQFMRITADERKILLAAGAAAGMSATFGSPVSAVLLAVELLLFEYSPRALVPVALASATAAGVRILFHGTDVDFPMTGIVQPSEAALVTYIVLGAIIGLCAVVITKLLYAIEEGFEKLPIHWMWWPAIGALAVGIVGYFVPRTLGVGYSNMSDILAGNLTTSVLVLLITFKFISWSIALGSGTSGGTLAPLFTIGGGIGALLGIGIATVAPSLGVDPRIAGLVGMAAIFAGASRALLASVVFAFEITRQPIGLLPMLGGGTAAFLISTLLMRNTIMTEKLVRRGTRIPSRYTADFLDQVLVRDFASAPLITLQADDTVESVRNWMSAKTRESSHQGFPVLDGSGMLLGVITRRDLLDNTIHGSLKVISLISRPAVVVYDDNSLREAADHMVMEGVGRLPVVTRTNKTKAVGIITRSDLLRAHENRLHAQSKVERVRSVRSLVGV